MVKPSTPMKPWQPKSSLHARNKSLLLTRQNEELAPYMPKRACLRDAQVHNGSQCRSEAWIANAYKVDEATLTDGEWWRGEKVDVKDGAAQEWAKWALKNLVHGNERAEQQLAGLQTQAVLPSAELQRMGLEVSLDREFNKLRIQQVGPSASGLMPGQAHDFFSGSSSSASP